MTQSPSRDAGAADRRGPLADTARSLVWLLLLLAVPGIGAAAEGEADAATGKPEDKELSNADRARADPRCTVLDGRQSYGPFDYRERHVKRRQNLGVVQKYHFTPEIQRRALRGLTEKNTWFELDYTLRAFPNHAPALYLLGTYEDLLASERKEYYQQLTSRPKYSPFYCYFWRAVRFAPDDPNVWNSLGRIHTRARRFDDAIVAFDKVVKLAPRSAAAHYNLGLAYFAAERFEEAAASAKQAYALGYKHKDLARRLADKGHWE